MMKNIISVLAITLIFVSCSSSKIISTSDISGNYTATYKGVFNLQNETILNLNYDGTFHIKIKGIEWVTQCSGIWTKTGNKIFLKCDVSDDIATMLNTGYMGGMEFILTIKNKNKLVEAKKIVYKRQKQ